MIIGNLTRDPESKKTPQGTTVTTFSVATNLVWNDASGQKQERVEYHNVVAWRKLGEICAQYLKKGSKVYLEGRLQTRDWAGQDGVKRYRTEIVAENMIMLDRAGSSNFTPASNTQIDTAPAGTVIPEDDNKHSDDDNGDDIKIENIPF